MIIFAGFQQDVFTQLCTCLRDIFEPTDPDANMVVAEDGTLVKKSFDQTFIKQMMVELEFLVKLSEQELVRIQTFKQDKRAADRLELASQEINHDYKVCK